MLDIRRKSALMAGAFVVFVGPAYAQTADEIPATDPVAGQQQMPGETTPMGAQPRPQAAPAPGTATDAVDQPQQQAMPAQPGAEQPDADPALISRVQEALDQAGHDPGPVDGIWGPRSRSAMESFQRDRGIEPTGLINVLSLEALGLSDVAAQLEGDIGVGQPESPGMAEPTPGVQPTPRVGEPAPGVEATPGVATPTPGLGEPGPGIATPTPGLGEPGPGAQPGATPTPGLGQPAPGTAQPEIQRPATAPGAQPPAAPPTTAQPTQPLPGPEADVAGPDAGGMQTDQ